MIHRYVATFIYTARFIVEAEDEYEAEDIANDISEERIQDKLEYDSIEIEQE